MDTNRSARAEIIDLDVVRRRRKAQQVYRSLDAHDDANLARNMGFSRELADSISLQEGYDIALGIVTKFSVRGSLLQAFIDRRKRESANENEEFHVVLLRQRKMVASHSTDDLKALLALYAKKPSEYYETYVVPAAEEFLSRFQENVEEA